MIDLIKSHCVSLCKALKWFSRSASVPHGTSVCVLCFLSWREGKALHLLEAFAHFTCRETVSEPVILPTVSTPMPCGPPWGDGGPTGLEDDKVISIPWLPLRQWLCILLPVSYLILTGRRSRRKREWSWGVRAEVGFGLCSLPSAGGAPVGGGVSPFELQGLQAVTGWQFLAQVSV